ncbi:MAG: hypothetical protein HYU28_02010 [Actinobacteria bacterium]|nr:hypothetical protein [Actinomycetota bacterium]
MRSRAARVVFAPAALALLLTGASAASLGGLTSGSVGAGSVAVSPCDANGFSYSYTLSVGVVTAVLVGGVADPACEGGTITVKLANSSGTEIGTGSTTVATDGDTADNLVTVSLSVQPAATNVAAVHTVVTGP